jgi:transposase
MARNFERQLRAAAKRAREASRRRDEVIVEASEAGMSRRAVAAAVGLSVGRVQQIVERER